MPDWRYLEATPMTEDEVARAARATMPDTLDRRIKRLVRWRRHRKALAVITEYMEQNKIRILYELRNMREKEAQG